MNIDLWIDIRISMQLTSYSAILSIQTLANGYIDSSGIAYFEIRKKVVQITIGICTPSRIYALFITRNDIVDQLIQQNKLKLTRAEASGTEVRSFINRLFWCRRYASRSDSVKATVPSVNISRRTHLKGGRAKVDYATCSQRGGYPILCD